MPGVSPHRCVGFVRRPGGDGGGGAGPEGAERRKEVLVGLEDCISVLETSYLELESDTCFFFFNMPFFSALISIVVYIGWVGVRWQ